MTTPEQEPRSRRRVGRPHGLLVRYFRVVLVLALLVAGLAAAGPRLNTLVSELLARIGVEGGVRQAESVLAPFFTPEVRYWEAKIVDWASRTGLDPDLVATVIQIESCGDPGALSVAGAQGLMQVMPQHFAGTEDPLDPDTNARRGLGVLTECLTSQYNPNRDIGLAFACYNGGPSVFVYEWNFWPQQSRDYYIWGTGIYADALVRQPQSETLNRWLAAGGANLCAAARQRLGLDLDTGS